MIVVDTTTGESREADWLQTLEIARAGLDRIIGDGEQSQESAFRLWDVVQMLASLLDVEEMTDRPLWLDPDAN